MRGLLVLISGVLLVVALLFANGRSFDGQAEYRVPRRSGAEVRIEQRTKPAARPVGQMPSGYRTMARTDSLSFGGDDGGVES